MAKKKDSFDEWLEGERAEPPSVPRHYKGMTDDELSDAICRAAIEKGHDPASEGVITDAKVMEEEGASELAYKNKLKAQLAVAIAGHFGVARDTARRSLTAVGTIPLGHDADPSEQAAVDDLVKGHDVQDLVLKTLDTSTDVAVGSEEDIALLANFVRQIKMHYKWLGPLAIFLGSLAASAALGYGGGGALFLFFLLYGFFFGGFREMSQDNPTRSRRMIRGRRRWTAGKHRWLARRQIADGKPRCMYCQELLGDNNGCSPYCSNCANP